MNGFAYMLHPAWLSWILPILCVITLIFLAKYMDARRKNNNQKKKTFGVYLLISMLLLIGWCIRLFFWFCELHS